MSVFVDRDRGIPDGSNQYKKDWLPDKLTVNKPSNWRVLGAAGLIINTACRALFGQPTNTPDTRVPPTDNAAPTGQVIDTNQEEARSTSTVLTQGQEVALNGFGIDSPQERGRFVGSGLAPDVEALRNVLIGGEGRPQILLTENTQPLIINLPGIDGPVFAAQITYVPPELAEADPKNPLNQVGTVLSVNKPAEETETMDDVLTLTFNGVMSLEEDTITDVDPDTGETIRRVGINSEGIHVWAYPTENESVFTIRTIEDGTETGGLLWGLDRELPSLPSGFDVTNIYLDENGDFVLISTGMPTLVLGVLNNKLGWIPVPSTAEPLPTATIPPTETATPPPTETATPPPTPTELPVPPTITPEATEIPSWTGTVRFEPRGQFYGGKDLVITENESRLQKFDEALIRTLASADLARQYMSLWGNTPDFTWLYGSSDSLSQEHRDALRTFYNSFPALTSGRVGGVGGDTPMINPLVLEAIDIHTSNIREHLDSTNGVLENFVLPDGENGKQPPVNIDLKKSVIIEIGAETIDNRALTHLNPNAQVPHPVFGSSFKVLPQVVDGQLIIGFYSPGVKSSVGNAQIAVSWGLESIARYGSFTPDLVTSSPYQMIEDPSKTIIRFRDFLGRTLDRDAQELPESLLPYMLDATSSN